MYIWSKLVNNNLDSVKLCDCTKFFKNKNVSEEVNEYLIKNKDHWVIFHSRVHKIPVTGEASHCLLYFITISE